MNSRALSARILHAVLEDSISLSQALPAQLATQPGLRDPQLVQAIVYGVLRHYYEIDALIASLLAKPLKAKEADLQYLLQVGLFQLKFLSVPHHIVLNETVNAAKQLGKPWATGLVNGVLRQYLREPQALETPVKKKKSKKKSSADEHAELLCLEYNHPLWLIERLREAWPTHWQAILQANQMHPPMTLRVNTHRITREDYQSLLASKGIESHILAPASSALTLASPHRVEQLPFFADGYISVQDAASQLAAFLLDCPPDAHVLDACAAPGGKTCHILEEYPLISPLSKLAAECQKGAIKELVAVDIDKLRLTKVQENLSRLKLTATLKTGNVCEPETWWDGILFDRILCDAPCSASGVIRRHPDIKFLRYDEDIAVLQQQQMTILKALWPLLKTGGKLVYSTCSVFPEENTLVLQDFLANEPSAHEEVLSSSWGHAQTIGRQILPGEEGMDGFYYAVLRKV
ncbi:MAG: 16S rRNA (cytosine(967)-C(5))-methyltransferase RsmB [Legionellales bacterium]|nr:16S rRNA (cytosine(967)-C(5))-methyltransferase RsmB [Legionellales bacterium]